LTYEDDDVSCTSSGAPTYTTSDNCEVFATSTENSETTKNICYDDNTAILLKEIVYTSIVTDTFSNTGTDTATIRVWDNETYGFDQTSPSTPTEFLDESCQISYTDPTASGGCGGGAFTAQRASGETDITDFTDISAPSGQTTETRNFFATHPICNNQYDFQDIVTVKDNRSPTLTDLDTTPNAEVCRPPTASGSCEDNCECTTEITEEYTQNGCIHRWTWSADFFAVDNFGNDVSDTLTDSYDDRTPPVITPSSDDDTNLECPTDAYAPITCTVEDECASYTDTSVTWDEGDWYFDKADGWNPGDDYSVIVYWTQTDECANEGRYEHTINIADNTPPTFESVDNFDQLCTLAAPEPPTAADTCDGPVQVNPTGSYTLSNADCCEACGVYVYTYAASDLAGNFATAEQTVTVRDTAAPEFISLPTEPIRYGTADCEPPPPLDLYASDCAFGGNGQQQVEFDPDTDKVQNTTYERAPGSSLLEIWYYTYTIEDTCGNSVTAVETIHIIDEEPPSFDADVDTLPPVTHEGCFYTPPEPPSSDDCDDNPSVTSSVLRSDGSCPGQYTVEYAWLVTDHVGKTDTINRFVDIVDNYSPELTIVDENGDEWIQSNWDAARQDCKLGPQPTATAFDPCEDDLSQTTDLTAAIQFSEARITQDNDNPDDDQYVWAWHVADDCGNTDDATSTTITLSDTTPPDFCEKDDVAWYPTDITTTFNITEIPDFDCYQYCVSDDCDPDPDYECEQEYIEGTCLYVYSIVRTFTSTDRSGNENVTSYTIDVVDAGGPELLNVPDDKIYYDWAAYQTEVNQNSMEVYDIKATDATGPDGQDIEYLTVFETIDAPIQNSGTWEASVQKCYSASDECGNYVSDCFTISVIDLTPPVIDICLGNVEVECDSIPEPGSPSLIGDTTGILITLEEDNISIAPSIIRTWTAVDDAANSNTATLVQTITVIDSIDPIFDNFATFEQAECGCLPLPPTVSAIDNCGSQVIVGNNTETFATDTNGACTQPDIDCENAVSYQVTTYTAQESGFNQNTKTAYHTLVVLDNTPPAWANEAETLGSTASASVSCSEIPAFIELTAYDVCDDASVTVERTEEETACDPPSDDCYMITRTWTAEDSQQNTISKQQQLVVLDNTAPVEIDGYWDICLFPANDLWLTLDLTEFFSDIVFDDCDTTVVVEGANCQSSHVSSGHSGCIVTGNDLKVQASVLAHAHGGFRTYEVSAIVKDTKGNALTSSRRVRVFPTEEVKQRYINTGSPRTTAGVDNGITGDAAPDGNYAACFTASENTP